MVFLFGALCYTVCTMNMNAPPQGGAFIAFTIQWHLTEASSPGPGEEASWCSCSFYGIPVQCSVLYPPRPEKEPFSERYL